MSEFVVEGKESGLCISRSGDGGSGSGSGGVVGSGLANGSVGDGGVEMGSQSTDGGNCLLGMKAFVGWA